MAGWYPRQGGALAKSMRGFGGAGTFKPPLPGNALNSGVLPKLAANDLVAAEAEAGGLVFRGVLGRFVPLLGLALTGYEIWKLYKDFQVMTAEQKFPNGYITDFFCEAGEIGPTVQAPSPTCGSQGAFISFLNGQLGYARVFYSGVGWCDRGGFWHQYDTLHAHNAWMMHFPVSRQTDPMTPFPYIHKMLNPLPRPFAPPLPWVLLPYVVPQYPSDAGYDAPRQDPDPKRPEPGIVQGFKPGARPTVARPPLGRRPPGPKEKERKRKTHLPMQALFHEATEWSDLVTSLYDALPKNAKVKYRKGKPIGLGDKANALYHNFQDVDLDTALFNLLWNEVEDRLIGSTVGKAGEFFSSALGGENRPGERDVTLGPAGQDAIGGPLGMASGKAKSAVRDWLNTHTTLTITK